MPNGYKVESIYRYKPVSDGRQQKAIKLKNCVSRRESAEAVGIIKNTKSMKLFESKRVGGGHRLMNTNTFLHQKQQKTDNWGGESRFAIRDEYKNMKTKELWESKRVGEAVD